MTIPENIQQQVPLKKFSTFSVGGNADFFVEISEQHELRESVLFAQKNNLKIFLLGGGSNIVFADEGFRGLVIHMKNQKITSQKNGVFTAESGSLMGQIFGFCKKEHRDFALLSSIPGTIGGATAGNAGLPSGEIKDIFCSATVYDTQSQKFLTKDPEFFNFQYRKTNFHTPEFSQRYIIWDITFQLPFLKEEKIESLLKENFLVRKSKQPYGKTGGSFFFNPGKGKEGAAGYLIEQVGLKGFAVGDAYFSEKHANFLMNKKNATQADIKTLAQLAQKKVREKFGIPLNPEVKIVNEFGQVEKISPVTPRITIPKNLSSGWKKHISDESQKPYFHHLEKFLEAEYAQKKTIYPAPEHIFSAFEHTPLEKIKVVILGQDPYHGENQAHGLSFSVPESQTKIPPSLRNIFKEIQEEYSPFDSARGPHTQSGNLEYLADQGVFLLNATLTVEAGKAGSHQKKGWEEFTDSIIRKISEERENIVFLLWGSFAQKKSILIDEKKHCIFTAPHPSPLSSYRGFFGCDHFKKTNTFLESKNSSGIKWMKN